ncbi:MAG: DoxX family protein, partial [Acidimicrobiales bacterium]
MKMSVGAKLLAGLLGVAGVTHFAAPKSFEDIVPGFLPAHRGLVYASGVAELACAAGLVRTRTRRLAGWASAALFVAVFPANVYQAVQGAPYGSSGVLASKALPWLRLPLQVPLVVWALRVARSAEAGPRAQAAP